MPVEPLFLSILYLGVAFSFGIISLKMKGASGSKSIFVLVITLLLCSFSPLFPTMSHGKNTGSILYAGFLFGETIAAIAMFTFSLEHTYRSHWINPFSLMLLGIVPLLTQAFYWMPGDSLPFDPHIQPVFFLGKQIFLEKVNQLYSLILLVNTVWVLVPENNRKFGLSTFLFWATLIGPLIALATHTFALLEIRAPWPIETIMPIAISASIIGFSYSTFVNKGKKNFLLRREEIIERMQDGWIILDETNNIMDINQATVDLTGLAREKLYSQPIKTIWSDFPVLSPEITDSQKIEIEKAYKVNDQWRYLNIHISKLNYRADTPTGYLVTWRDISNRRHAEKVRQKARDEMFVLLNAISSAASQTSNLSEFLSEVIYQIIYPFRSQVVLIYILDERLHQENNYENNLGNESAYFLAAYLGLSTEQSKSLHKVSSSHPLFSWLNENRKHLLLNELQDGRIPEAMQLLPMAYFLAIPLVNQTMEEKKLIGALFLGRKDTPVYNQDEIERLSLLSEQIAILVDSDRRRKLAILLTERQRLMRDMHDSVSQKLYGLVTLTEAAQAAIEANSPLDHSQVIARINENARQAVKELRLFLFQMRPVDVENEGLISVLHHRMAAVEGRADIKARFLADDVTLSKRQEVALYFIAQEALNNVLRHAQANSVTVNLKQSQDNIILEVIDDGSGFDPENVAPGRMGLNNIEERVKQLNGKLKILSKPGAGTIIEVTLEKDSQDI